MNNPKKQAIIFLLVICACIVIFSLVAKDWLATNKIAYQPLLFGNIILFAVTTIAFLVTSRALESTNPQSFVRAMYAGFMIKFFIVIIAAFIYIKTSGKQVNKPALGFLALLYIIYTVAETRALTRILKQKKNA
jgi:hypothetical protein